MLDRAFGGKLKIMCFTYKENWYTKG